VTRTVAVTVTGAVTARARTAILASTAIAFLIPSACGRTSLLDGWRNQPVDAPKNRDSGVGDSPAGSDVGAETRRDGGSDGGLAVSGDAAYPAEVRVPMLKLLAGAIGGYGDRDGTGPTARFNNPTGVASDGAGNIFVADSWNHTIRKVVIATGAVTTLAGSPENGGSTDGTGPDARFYDPSGVASDGAGNLFVADSDNHTIRKVVIATGVVTTLAGSPGNRGNTDGTGPDARFGHPSAVASDRAGNLFVADSENCTIRKIVIATGVVTTLAGSPGNWGNTDGTGPDARFGHLSGVASDGAGYLFVTDPENCTIRKILIATAAVTTLAGSPGNRGKTDGTGPDARFGHPSGVASDGAGNLFVNDSENCTIRKIVIATAAVTTLAGSPGNGGKTDGTGPDARFSGPQGVVSDGAGNLFAADSGNHTIRRVVIATAAVTTLAGTPENWDSTDGTGASARFGYPSGVASDGAGNLLVADTDNYTIRKVVIATAAVTTLAGTPRNAGIVDGTGPDARFSGPSGVASDGAGNLFVADTENYTIRKVVIATGVVSTLAGAPGSSGTTDGTGPDARFYYPRGVASDGAGCLFVVDSENHTIRKVVIATGVVTTLAGSPRNWGTTDGTGPDARFNRPWGVASDGAGNLLVTDTGNDSVRKVVIATGAVTTLAGSAGHSGSADDTGNAARFLAPGAAAYDGAGSFFVGDARNHTIRKVAHATGAVTTVVGSPGHAGVILGPLPAGLNLPQGLAFGPKGDLYIMDENAVLVAQF